MFWDAALSTSRTMPIIYGGLTEEYVKNHGYFSQAWTAWGLAYALFGWTGGIGALLLTGVALHGGYLFLIQHSARYLPYVTIWYLFVAPMLLYLSMGLDHSVTTFLVLLLQTVAVLYLLDVVSAASRWWQNISQIRSHFSKYK